MPTTPAYGFPYPAPTAPATAGAVNLQQLATAVEAKLLTRETEWAAAYGGGFPFVGTSVVLVGFEMPVGNSPGFAVTETTFTYTGPLRLFRLHAAVTMNDESNPDNNTDTIVEMFVGETRVAHSRDYAPVENVFVRVATHHLDALYPMGAGSVVTVRARTGTNTVRLADRSLSAVSVSGPL